MNILEKKKYIEDINSCLDLRVFSEAMMDAFILGYKLGKTEAKDKLVE